MNALDWLGLVERHPDLSDDAKTAAVFMADGWTGAGARCRKGLQYVLDNSGLANYWDVCAVANELRSHGFLTGKGLAAKPWKLQDPVVRLPVVRELRRRQAAQAQASDLERRLRMLANGSLR